MTAITRSRLPIPAVTAIALVAALMLVFVSPAASQSPDARGADLLSALERGETECSDLDGADYAAIGELAMGRMVGSPQAHEAMDELIARMMGESGLTRMHEVRGQRFAGCGAAGMPPGFGQMMGMMGGGSGGLDPSAMMGGGYIPGNGTGAPDGRYAPGSMMGFAAGRANSAEGIEPWMAVMMLGLTLAVVVGAFLLVPRRRSNSGPLEALAERFARGELSAEDYRERRQLLLGGGK